MDATLIEAEKRDAQWSDQGLKGAMPRLGFLVETPICLLEEFREGNVSPGSGHLTFYRACQAALPAGKHLGAYRADSASYQAALVNALEADGVRFSITADQDAAVKTLLRELPEAAWTEPPPGCGYELAEAVHTMEKTTTAFRMVCTRTLRRQLALPGDPEIPDVYYVIATNWSPEEKATPDVVDWHNQRGQAENLIKDLKHGIGLERVPCGETWANAVWFRLGVIAYTLVVGFRRLACPPAWARHTISTLRWRLLQVAGRIVRHGGQVVLRLVVEAERLALLRGIRRQCWAMTGAT